MKNYNSIDIGKFVACIGIIAIHANPIYASYHIADSVVAFMASLCVPFFFLRVFLPVFQQAGDDRNAI